MTIRAEAFWDVPVTETELRARLSDPDPDIRAQWEGRLLREANYTTVWKYVSLAQVLRDWERLKRHLGRRRAFWEYLLQGWRRDGLIPA